jgi:hypothetical protein
MEQIGKRFDQKFLKLPLVPNLRITDEPTWRCPQNPFIGALGIQEPVISDVAKNGFLSIYFLFPILRGVDEIEKQEAFIRIPRQLII